MIVLLSACQSVEKNTKLIAGTFNTATNIQMKMLDRFAPPDVIVHNNIPYQASPELNVDIYQPKNIEQLNAMPTVVWIHGGGWVSGSKEHARGYFKLLANQGFNVVSVEYQFAPEAIYPTQLQQVDHALNFLQLNAAQYRINPNQLYLAGDSAGANIASHDDHGIAEAHSAPAVIGQAPVIQQLQQNIEYIRVRLFNLIKQDHAVGLAPHRFGQLSTLLISYIPWGRAHQARALPCPRPGSADWVPPRWSTCWP